MRENFKWFWLGEAWDEATRKTVLVRSNHQGRNLSQKGSIPQEYCPVWWHVYATSITDARSKVAAGQGCRHS